MNYGKFARSYQFLSRLVFGDTLIRAQKEALSDLVYPCHLLMVGGGDGEILRHLGHFEGVLDYVEISEKMVNQAQLKSPFPTNWHIRDIFTFQAPRQYDEVFLPFFLDNFCTEQCAMLLRRLKAMLLESGRLTVVDFTESPTALQRVLLHSMYTFFRCFAGVEVRRLPAMEQAILQAGFSKTRTVKTFGGFIETKWYTLNPPAKSSGSGLRASPHFA